MPVQPTRTPDVTAQADAAYYRRVLHDLIDMGADLARMVHAQAQADATAQPDPVGDAAPTIKPSPDPTVAFDRIARTIRRTIGLARRLDTPATSPAEDARPHRAAARRRILREVEDAIQRVHDSDDTDGEAGGDGCDLHAELLDRLDGPDLDDEIDQRPTAAIIADLCRDMGLLAPPGTRPWKRRTPGDIAVLCARAALPPGGSPAAADAADPDRRVRLVAAATGPSRRTLAHPAA